MEALQNHGTSDRSDTVLIVAHAWYDDLFGGAFRVASELAIGMAASGWHVTYLCCNVANAPDREEIQGVHVRRYALRQQDWYVPRFWQHIRGASLLAKEIASEFNILAVSGHSPLQYLGALTVLSRADSSRYAYVVHSPFADEVLASAGGNRLNWRLQIRAIAAWFIDRWCLRRSGAAHCLSRYTIEALERRYGLQIRRKCIELPGWVNTKQFQPSENRKQLRASLSAEWQTEGPVLFTVRRLESRMGLDTLIDAAARIADRHRFRILIGGIGSQAEALNQAIKSSGLQNRVYLLGRIPEEQLAQCFAASDVFVLPTRSMECFGLIVLEAFASGIPVIGSRVGAIPELISQVGDQWMFEPGDAAGLARCLSLFLQGQLSTTVDLREISIRYDIRRILPRWIDATV